MHKPTLLDIRAISELNGLMSNSGRHFIIFWEYYPYPFTDTTWGTAFLECVLALYRLYVDCGAGRLKYCFDQHRHGRSELLAFMQRHYNNVCNLRTFFAHNVYLSNEVNRATYEKAPRWFQYACGEAFPSTEASWKSCYDALVSEADTFHQRLLIRITQMTTGINRRILLEEAFRWYAGNLPENQLYTALQYAVGSHGLRWSSEQLRECIRRNMESWKSTYRDGVLYRDDPYIFLLSILSDHVSGVA